jgi:hypothetical protein
MVVPALSPAVDQILANAQLATSALTAGATVVLQTIHTVDSKMELLLKFVLDEIQQQKLLAMLRDADPQTAAMIMQQLKLY